MSLIDDLALPDDELSELGALLAVQDQERIEKLSDVNTPVCSIILTVAHLGRVHNLFGPNVD